MDIYLSEISFCHKMRGRILGGCRVVLAELSIMQQLIAQPAKTVMKVGTIIQSRTPFIIHNAEQ